MKLKITSILTLLIVSATMFAKNEKPFVIPEIAQWKGGEGYFELNYKADKPARIVYQADSLEFTANTLASDLKILLGKDLPVMQGKPSKGDIYLSISKDRKLSGEEYKIEIDKNVVISSKTKTGLMWGVRTIEQIFERSGKPSLPKGRITDGPAYPVRGFMLDCGRKFFPIDYLKDCIRTMSYYKMNIFQIHLNDNGFKQFFDYDWNSTYSAFRLESETYPGLAAKDGYYTKEEFRDLQEFARNLGVEIVPEIDSPAHSLAFTQYRPEIGSEKYGMDHLDLTKKETYDFMDALFKEYLEGENPVFSGRYVSIGTDEYSNENQEVVEQFRAYTDHYISFVESFGKNVWMWGALTHAKGETPVKSENVTLSLWNTGFANPDDMKAQGYKMISMNDWDVYIVPGTTYYHDYFDLKKLYEGWKPSTIGKFVFDEKDPAIVGGMFAVWNDHVGNGISTSDVYHRSFPAIQTFSAKMWSYSNTYDFDTFDSYRKSSIEAPGVNRLGRISPLNLEILAPDTETGVTEAGYDYVVEFEIDMMNEQKGTVLFESPNSVFYLSDPIREMLGFSRDGYLFTFNYKIEPGKARKIRIEGTNKGTKLYVDGKLADEMKMVFRYHTQKDRMAYVPTLVFPLQKTGVFNSKISNFNVRNTD